jgi:hypothetical protein
MDDSLILSPTITRVVLDVLKPHQPVIHELASRIVSCNGANRVKISLAEIDQNTESIKVQVEGSDINLETIRNCIEEMGATIHSVDEVEVARKV